MIVHSSVPDCRIIPIIIYRLEMYSILGEIYIARVLFRICWIRIWILLNASSGSVSKTVIRIIIRITKDGEHFYHTKLTENKISDAFVRKCLQAMRRFPLKICNLFIFVEREARAGIGIGINSLHIQMRGSAQDNINQSKAGVESRSPKHFV